MEKILGNDFWGKRYVTMVGKFKRDPEQKLLPVWAHLLDTAGVMNKLVREWLPGHIVEIVEKSLSADDFYRVCEFVALTHDISKFTPIFQTKICERSDFLKGQIEERGIDLPKISDFQHPNGMPHAYAGEALLVQMGCPAGVAAVVGAHHGMPFSEGVDPDEDLEFCIEFYGDNFYAKQQKEWEEIWKDWVAFACECCGYENIEKLPEIDVPAQMLITCLLIMADWISSNETYAPWLFLDENIHTLRYPERIENMWAKVSFPGQWMPSSFFMNEEDFELKYGYEPNEVQKKIVEIVEDSVTPGIYILEAPMGSGKTEAALAAAEILASKWHCEGVFFGLPTQATSNGIFPRLKEWAAGQTEGVQLSIRLAHGMAKLQKDYRELFHGHAWQEEDNPEGEKGLVVHSWFEGRKQALLSSFVVGTVDQLLMAALQQKHVMLRHLGLAGKVVIVDECHAYDAYMNSYLERALEWLGIYQVPVILLSATLPADRRARLIHAYLGMSGKRDSEKKGNDWETSESYPLLTYTYDGQIHQADILSAAKKKKISIARSTTEGIAGVLKEKLKDGGCAGVIMNTVGKAQEVSECLQEEFPESTVLLLHSRFTMLDRQKLEEELLSRLGKKSTPEMRNLIVVGTQLLEQSLDIDFDILVTQLAPMDLLLQRIGRLHRHGWRKRPQRLQNPVCVVCDVDEWDKGSEQIYRGWLLTRTAKLLPDTIWLPDDISPLVQEVYRNVDKNMNQESQKLWDDYNNEAEKRRRKAAAYRIIGKRDFDETIHNLLDSSISNREADALRQVRDGEASISVLLMVEQEDGVAGFVPWQSDGERIPWDHVPAEEECCKILQQKVQLPRILSVYHFEECIAQLEEYNAEKLSEWQRSRWLAGEYIMMLSGELETELCGYILKYSKNNGLMCRKEEQNE